jgi:acetate kinase
MNYIDNWQSEMHETFGFYSFSEWENELEKIGFKIVKGSQSFQSKYIIEKMYKERVNLYSLSDGKLIEEDYPPTNMILVGEK